jgi:glyoxylase-like metal-dependent hydrolase (beta-lactamase superfamily II)
MAENFLRFAHQVGEGVYAIDTAFFRLEFDSCYLVTQVTANGTHAAFIDVGTTYSAPRLIASLEDLGLMPEDVKYIIPTHVHLDHAGGAGEMMRLCSNAKLIIHPRGARHMIDPTALRAGAVGVYGEEVVQKEYGHLVPIPRDRVVEAPDGFEVDLGGRKLLCIDTPGHAKHHMCIWDEQSKGIFTGDTFGLSYREFDTDKGSFVIPSSTPIQFDPIELRRSIAKIMAHHPKSVYLTHYSCAKNVPYLESQFLEVLDQVEALGLSLKNSENRHEKLVKGLSQIYLDSVKKHGCTMPDSQVIDLLELDIDLNAQGMGIWLDR